MLIVVGDAIVEPSNRARMDEAARAMIAASRSEAGCIDYAYAWDMIEPERMRVTELWCDAEALRFHFRTPHMTAFLKALKEMANPAPRITVHEARDGHAIGRYATRQA